MSTWLIRHALVEVLDEGEALLIRSLSLNPDGLEHSNRNVLFIPPEWITAGLPPTMPIIYQQDRPTEYSDAYRSRVAALVSSDDPGHMRARLHGLIGSDLPSPRPADPLPMRITDEDDGAPVARLGIPYEGAMAEITVCGPSLEIGLTRGGAVRLEKEALAFALPILRDPGALVRLVRAGADATEAFDPALLRQIDYVDPSGARVVLVR